MVGAVDHQDQRRRLSAEEMQHSFSMRPAQDTSAGHAGEYLCHCVRCKWTFQVNPEKGSILALDDAGLRLVGAEATKRINSFTRGLCPAYSAFPEYAEALAVTHHGIRAILHPVLRLLGLDSAAE